MPQVAVDPPTQGEQLSPPAATPSMQPSASAATKEQLSKPSRVKQIARKAHQRDPDWFRQGLVGGTRRNPKQQRESQPEMQMNSLNAAHRNHFTGSLATSRAGTYLASVALR